MAGRRIAFVPTMGALHDGHVALLNEARRRADVVVLSIFVNPMQFLINQDPGAYPRALEADLAIARNAKVDLVFAPEPDVMYPQGAQTRIEVRELSRPFAGSFGESFAVEALAVMQLLAHATKQPLPPELSGLRTERNPFVGVSTVVAKLFNIVKPHTAFFGEKDFQQLTIVRQMVRDLNFDIEIIGVPIVRDSLGLALSSRNARLSRAERRRALSLCRALRASARLVSTGERDGTTILAAARRVLERAKARIEYLELRDVKTLEPVPRLHRGVRAVLAISAFIGATRLLDNRVLQSPRRR